MSPNNFVVVVCVCLKKNRLSYSEYTAAKGEVDRSCHGMNARLLRSMSISEHSCEYNVRLFHRQCTVTAKYVYQ